MKGLLISAVPLSLGLVWFLTQFPQKATAQAAFPTIASPADARALKLESLRTAIAADGGVPLPPNLDDFVKDRAAAIRLGKALFWDMQVGSDGVQACASCHFAFGADNRSRNDMNPDITRVKNQRNGDIRGFFDAPSAPDNTFSPVGPDQTLKAANYPFVRKIDTVVQNPDGTLGPAAGNTNDVASSMGAFLTLFQGVDPGQAKDDGTRLNDPVWNVGGVTTRRVEPRHTPAVVNAVLNFTNFWDGRANNTFNGVNPFGPQDPDAAIFVRQPNGDLQKVKIALRNASLASQSVGPPLSPFEMSFGNPDQNNFRTFPDLGKKLLRGGAFALTPLGKQVVSRQDSVLGGLARSPQQGLSKKYDTLIREAFQDKYWASLHLLKLVVRSASPFFPVFQLFPKLGYDVVADNTPDNTDIFTQMEANFSLFFGISVMLYESTLIADHSPFDVWMETGTLSSTFNAEALAGLNLFVGKAQCTNCHGGPEFSNASVRNAENGKNVIEPMEMARGFALYDNGFYNIGVVPTTDDLGRGGKDLNGNPLAFSRQALFSRVLGIQFPFPIVGNDGIPAVGEDGGPAVCNDVNHNGFCDPNEPINAAFQRDAVDGAFKTPQLRDSALTAPYMHNGGLATLRQVVEFYNRGGNFCNVNKADLDPDMEPRGLTNTEIDQVVTFLIALTDDRVRLEKAPFDHPQLFVPATGFDEIGKIVVNPVGAGGTNTPQKPFLSGAPDNLTPRTPIFTPPGLCNVNP